LSLFLLFLLSLRLTTHESSAGGRTGKVITGKPLVSPWGQAREGIARFSMFERKGLPLAGLAEIVPFSSPVVFRLPCFALGCFV
jgi:hypothetical protein